MKDIIVITGASSGLGHEVAKLLKTADNILVNVARSDCSVADHNIKCDLTKTDDIENAAKQINEMTGKLSAVINNAGVWGEEPVGEMTSKEVSQLLAVNLAAPMLFTSRLLERIKQDGADVVNIVSTAGLKDSKDYAAYSASKWGERGYTNGLRAELQDTASRVIGVYPGGIKTKFFEKNTGNDITEDGSYWLDPVEVAKTIKTTLDLPKGVEISEIVINRKKKSTK